MNQHCRAAIPACLAALLLALSGFQPAFAHNSTSEPGVDRPGRDYRNFETGSDTQCLWACERDSNRCQAWTWVRPGIQGPQGRCWLKDFVAPPVKNGCCNSGVMEKSTEVSVDRPGNDYRNFEVPSGQFWTACRDACRAEGHCGAWTYVKPGLQGPLARCWLKNTIPPAWGNTCCVSGVVKRGEYQDW
jgi:hypothetical protein